MAQSDNIKRYLDAGVAFTQMTRERAEEIVKELVKQGEVARKEAESRVEELVDRSRRQTEELVGLVRAEVARQLKALGLEDLAKRAQPGPTPTTKKVSTPTRSSGATAPGTKTVTQAPSKGSAGAAKSPAKSSAAKKPATKSSAAKSSAAKKSSSTGKSATKKKSAATKSSAAKKA